jgi:hypothetical protein
VKFSENILSQKASLGTNPTPSAISPAGDATTLEMHAMSNLVSIAALGAADYVGIGGGCYLVCFFIFLFLTKRMPRQLSPEEAVALCTGPFKAAIWIKIGLAIAIALFIGLGFLGVPWLGLAIGTFLCLGLAVNLGCLIWHTRRLRTLGINSGYMRAHGGRIIALSLALAGLLLALVSSQFVPTTPQASGTVKGPQEETKATR